MNEKTLTDRCKTSAVTPCVAGILPSDAAAVNKTTDLS